MSVYILAAFVGMGACARRGLPLLLRPPLEPGLDFASVTPPAQDAAAAAVDLGSLAAISDAVESGLGLPEVVRAAARALDASLVLIDRSSSVLAVAARSTADERALMANAPGVSRARAAGRRRGRRPAAPARPHRASRRPRFLRVVTTLIASEVERLRAPDRASEAAQARVRARAIMRRKVTDRGDIVARGERARARPRRRRRRRRRARAPLRAGRRRLARRACSPPPSAPPARARPARSPRCSTPHAATAPPVAVLLPGGRGGRSSRRVAEAIARELSARLHGFTFAVGHSRVADRPRRPLPRRPRGAAGGQRRRGAPGRRRRPRSPRSRSRTPAPTGCCCPR